MIDIGAPWAWAGSPSGTKGGVHKAKNCDAKYLQECMDLLQTINKDHNLAFASTEQELNTMCKTMRSGLECVHRHVTKCFDETRQRVIYQLLSGTESIIDSLCNKGSFRDRYQIHAPCMKNLSTDANVCGEQYKRLILSVNPPEKLDYEDSIRQQCCAFHNYLLCVTSAAERECGTQAANFIEEYSYRTAGRGAKSTSRGASSAPTARRHSAGAPPSSASRSCWLCLSCCLGCSRFTVGSPAVM
ncbi:uncharacterized protein LOC119588875 [Penaeus monodon]|uniref:uncharacterized protein LOC119588875 n=1 Tax=Penaeus monodon TaxID=6687 RepID=UPI0018A7866F|nr:uncharacterized protein LOC119588875 [Penaeus monodon]